MKTILNVTVLLSAALLTSCTTQYNGVKPVSPGAYMPYEPSAWEFLNPINPGLVRMTHDKPVPQVDSLQPTLKWEAVPNVESYDVIIYRGVPKDRPDVTYSGIEKLEDKRTGWFVAGKEVYYREAIRDTSHRVEEPLQTNAVFVWSVRTRTGTNVSDWSTYDFRKGFKVIAKSSTGVMGNKWWWPFSTPKQ
jgi:hypothetical protein